MNILIVPSTNIGAVGSGMAGFDSGLASPAFHFRGSPVNQRRTRAPRPSCPRAARKEASFVLVADTVNCAGSPPRQRCKGPRNAAARVAAASAICERNDVALPARRGAACGMPRLAGARSLAGDIGRHDLAGLGSSKNGALSHRTTVQNQHALRCGRPSPRAFTPQSASESF